MNLSELLINKNNVGPFLITLCVVYSIYKYLDGIYEGIDTSLSVVFILTYIFFIITNKIVNTNMNFSKPLIEYIKNRKNKKEEAYQINYVNPYITNLDNVDFNMKLGTNKKYVKKILNELLLRKYLKFENVLGYNKNPLEVVDLEENGNKYTIIENPYTKKNNKYCMNYLSDMNILLLYRKYILNFINKKYFIFERKNKVDSKYYLFECISRVDISNDGTTTNYNTIIDTRDLYHERQYILFEGFVKDKNSKNENSKVVIKNNDQDNYNNFRDQPSLYYWQNDKEIKDIFVIDIHFIYNDMIILDENKNLRNKLDDTSVKKDTSADFDLNKYYNKQAWIIKKYYNFTKNQLNNRINSNNFKIYKDATENIKNTNIDDIETVRFKNILGTINKLTGENTGINAYNFNLSINEKSNKDINKFNNKLIIQKSETEIITLDFEEYIKEHIQNKDLEPNELVTIKNKNTRNSNQEDRLVDKNTLSYISFNFLNIKTIQEYREKMNIIAGMTTKRV